MGIETMTNYIPNQWKNLIQYRSIQATLGSWIGCFEINDQDIHLVVIFQSSRICRPILEECSWALYPSPPFPLNCFHISVTTHILNTNSLIKMKNPIKKHVVQTDKSVHR